MEMLKVPEWNVYSEYRLSVAIIKYGNFLIYMFLPGQVCDIDLWKMMIVMKFSTTPVPNVTSQMEPVIEGHVVFVWVSHPESFSEEGLWGWCHPNSGPGFPQPLDSPDPAPLLVPMVT